MSNLLKTKASLYQIPEEVWQKGLRIIDVFRQYQELLNGKGLVDSEDLILNLPGLLEKSESPELAIIEGFYNLTNAELKAVEALISRSKNCLAICFSDDAEKGVYKAFEGGL